MSSDSIDLQLFQLINDFAGRWHWLDVMGVFLAKDAAYILVAIVVLIFFFGLPRRVKAGKRATSRRMAIVSLASAALARGVVVELIRHWYHRVRPISVDAVHQLVINDKWAFPSGHASFFFALSAGITFYNKKLGLVFFIVSLLMGVARIFVGVHWPTDIMGGILIGCICAEIVQVVAKKFFPAKPTQSVSSPVSPESARG